MIAVLRATTPALTLATLGELAGIAFGLGMLFLAFYACAS